jgi:hypothetical protein
MPVLSLSISITGERAKNGKKERMEEKGERVF